MPIYEYRCDSCAAVFEEIHQHADDVMEQPCPECGKNAHRMISNTTFVLKGGGWYVTEYGNKKTDSNSGATKETPAADAQSGSAAKTETAPPAASSATGDSTAMAS